MKTDWRTLLITRWRATCSAGYPLKVSPFEVKSGKGVRGDRYRGGEGKLSDFAEVRSRQAMEMD